MSDTEKQPNSKQVMVDKKVWKPQQPTVVTGLYHEWKFTDDKELGRLVDNIIDQTTAGNLR